MTEQEVALRMRNDPVAFTSVFWPDVKLYNKQREILYAVRDCDETYVPAGNMLD